MRRSLARARSRALPTAICSSIADGLQGVAPASVAEAEPLKLEGLPKVPVRSLSDYRRRARERA